MFQNVKSDRVAKQGVSCTTWAWLLGSPPSRWGWPVDSDYHLHLCHHRHHIPQGGVDVQKALTIINVADGSPSEMSGLKVDFFLNNDEWLYIFYFQIGDVLLQINGRDCSMMTHKAAQDAIVGSGDRVDLLVQRWSAPAPAPQGAGEHLSKPDLDHLRRCLEARCAACRSTSHRSSSPGADLHTDKSCGQPCAWGLALGCEAQHHCQGGTNVDKLKRQNVPKQS